jgi:hypothetical protein
MCAPRKTHGRKHNEILLISVYMIFFIYICFSLIMISRSNSDNFAYGWSVPERNNVFYNVIVLMPLRGFEPWSL